MRQSHFHAIRKMGLPHAGPLNRQVLEQNKQGGLNIDLNLKGRDLVFGSKKECVDHHA